MGSAAYSLHLWLALDANAARKLALTPEHFAILFSFDSSQTKKVKDVNLGLFEG